LGHLFGAMSDVQALMGAAATARVLSGAKFTTRGTTIESDAAASPSVSEQIGDHWAAIQSWRGSQAGLFSAFRSVAEKILIQQVHLDATLPAKDVTTALTELIRQMRATPDSIQQSTVSAGAQTAVGSPTGNPVVVVSLKNSRGDTLQTPFAETLRIRAAGDSVSGGATARSEPLSILGQVAAADPFGYDWPLGSGCSLSVSLTDAQKDNSGQNSLFNSDFETFTTANYPDDWVVSVGAAGTDVLSAGSSDAYTQSNALKFTGDGATLITVYQEFNKAHATALGTGGTPFKLLPGTQYAVHGKVKVLTSAPAAGTLRVALVDSGATVINDDFGTANSFTVDLTAQTTSYASFSGSFRTPTNLPAIQRLQLKTTTALTSTKSVVMDDLAFTPMSQLYKGGPYVAAFAASANPILGDSWTLAISNTMGVIASWMERTFGMNGKGLVLPYSGSPSVADTLVV
jgi:hypothetical protein